MTVLALLRRLLLEGPTAPVGDFTARLNDCVQVLWESYRWPYYVTSSAVSARLAFTNLTVTNGATTATVVDADGGGLFHALHAGKSMTVVGERYTVSSVTDSNTLVLSTVSSDTGVNLAGSLPRVVFALPSNFGRLYGRPYRTSQVIPLGGYFDGYGDYLEDPSHYRLTGPVSGIWTMEFRVVLGEDYTVPYLRTVTVATGAGSTVDIGSGLERVLYQDLLRNYLRRVRVTGELELAQLQQRVRMADREYEAGLKKARGMAGTVSERIARNRPTAGI